MIHVGKDNILKGVRDSDYGLFLTDGQGNDVLLPKKVVPSGVGVGDELKVFVYHDSEDRIIATTLEPKIRLHEFACLEVKEVAQFGAFLDWGLDKDLLVPLGEQKKKMLPGEKHIVHLFVDKRTGRLAATAKLEKFFSKKLTVREGDEVQLLVGKESELGFEVIINDQHKGLIYHSEIFQPVKMGDRLVGYIKAIREDGKIDVSLQRKGYSQVATSEQVVLEALKANAGFLKLTDKSDPKLIEKRLKMSKKNFKRAVGALYKQKIIRIEDDGIALVED